MSFPRTLFLLLLGVAGATAAETSVPLTLDDAIRLALENNQGVRVSAYSPQIARAGVLAEYGRFDPSLTFSRSYDEAEAPGAFPSAIRPLAQTDDYGLNLEGLAPWGLTYSVGASAQRARDAASGFSGNYATFGGVSLTQPLLRDFGFGATLHGLRVAQASRGISEWQHRQTVIDTVTNVIFAYNHLQQARDNLRIARFSRGLAARLLTENEERLRIGAISNADVTQTRARVANREEAILVAERSLRDLENQFRQLLGRTDFTTRGPGLDLVELPPAPDRTVDAAQDYQAAIALRPDYQAARLGLKINRADLGYARNQLLPRVDLVGSYGYGGLDPNFRTARTQVSDREAHAYTAGVVMRVPLTFAQGRGRLRSARLTLLQAEAGLVRLEQEIALSIAAAAGQIETSQQGGAATRQALELARQALAAEEKRFNAGASSTYLVLQQQELLAGVENSHARALADQRRALAAYEREICTTLERHHITLAKY